MQKLNNINKNKKYIKYIHEMHQMMLSENLYLVYEGEFSQEIVKSVLMLTERNLNYFDEPLSIKRKVFNIMVECLQNICRHCYEEGNIDSLKYAIFMIGMEDGYYTIFSGNFMLKNNVDSLRSKLEKINGLDKEGLKELYKEIMLKGKRSPKGGAGLGLIDMARRSGQKLRFHFQEVEDNITFFSLRSLISKEKLYKE